APLVAGQIEGDAAFVQVQEEEVVRVAPFAVGAEAASLVAAARWLHLDDVGAEPGQDLGARRTRLELGQVDDADARESGHFRPPFVLIGGPPLSGRLPSWTHSRLGPALSAPPPSPPAPFQCPSVQ